MATAASRDIRKQLTSIAECSICRETFSDPRQLPCIHTYCLKCTEGFSRDRLPGDEVPCPLCRKEFTIPDGGVGSLPKNFFVQQLVDIASPTRTRCQGCSVDGREQSNAKSAIMFCVECSDRLCESCVESHRRMKITRTHKLVELEESGGLMETVMKLKTINCDKHVDKPLELYCFECKQVICMMCFVKLHQSHKCSELNEVAKEFCKQMTGDIKNMRETVYSCKKLIKGRKDYQVEFNRKLDVTEKVICDRVCKLKQLIDTEKTNLLKELSVIRTQRNKQMNNVVMEIEQHVSFVESMVTYTEQLRDMGTANDVAQQTNSLHVRAGELMKLDVIQQAINNLNDDEVTFTPANWSSQSQGSKVVGEIHKTLSHVASKPSTAPSLSREAMQSDFSAPVGRTLVATPAAVKRSPVTAPVVERPGVASKPSTTPTPSGAAMPRDSSTSPGMKLVTTPAAVKLSPITAPVVMRPEESKTPTLKQVIPFDGRQVVGLTFINNQLFVLREESKEEIQVYETSTFTQQRTVRVARLRDGWLYNTLTSCDVNNCLFVSDYYNVFTVDLSTDKVINWRVDGRPSGLSVNDARHVIVTCYNGDEIREYKPNGQLIRTIIPQVTGLVNAVQLTGSQYIVSHLGPVEGVSLLDTLGSVIATYRNSKSTKLLNCPRQLTVTENGSVLVADRGNNRLVVLDASLKNARELTLPIDGGLKGPWCLYFNESLGRLYVGESVGNRVVIFDNMKISFK